MRTPAAASAPLAGRWHLDPGTADVAFSGRASRLSPMVRASFRSVHGEVLAAHGPGAAPDLSVDVTVDVRSMSSGNRAWDDVVRAVDPFDAAACPTARFRSTSVRWTASEAQIQGRLELRGVSRPVLLHARHTTSDCGRRLAICATGELDREEFGLRFDVPGASLFLPRRLRLSIEAVAVHEELLVAA